MPEVYPDGSSARVFFDADANGEADLNVSGAYGGQEGLSIYIKGLKPLPAGSRYFLTMAPTPINEPHESGEK